MRLVFPDLSDMTYSSHSQRIRILSESWMKNEMYCPACGYASLQNFPNNSRLADFLCISCGEVYELKSKGSLIGKSILDGAYYAALERITSSTNPNLFVLHYERNIVEDLILIPRQFFTPNVLKIRRPLSQNARRAGYIGSVIVYSDIPEQGKIPIVEAHTEIDKDSVIKNYAQAAKLKIDNMNLRGWLMDIIICVNKIPHEIFSLHDIYAFADELRHKHIDNHNIAAKIRQQLQFLRDKGFIEFLGGGKYRKILNS